MFWCINVQSALSVYMNTQLLTANTDSMYTVPTVNEGIKPAEL